MSRLNAVWNDARSSTQTAVGTSGRPSRMAVVVANTAFGVATSIEWCHDTTSVPRPSTPRNGMARRAVRGVAARARTGIIEGPTR